MNIGILANEGSWYFRDLKRAALARGDICERLDFERLVSAVGRDFSQRPASIPALQTPTNVRFLDHRYSELQSTNGAMIAHRNPDEGSSASGRFDLILVRTMPPGSLEQVVYRMDVLGRLLSMGTKVVNSPKSLECAVDKYLTTARLEAAGLPVPETIVCEHEDDAMAAFEFLGRDVVVKPLFGAEGRGIVRVSDPDLAHRTFRTLMRLDSVLYLQRFIDHEGFDIRVLVLDGRALGAIRRCSPNDFRTNVSRNAVAEFHTPTSREIDLALQASSVTGTFIAGVDLLYDRVGKCYVIEVNAVPGWMAFTKATGIDVATHLLSACD